MLDYRCDFTLSEEPLPHVLWESRDPGHGELLLLLEEPPDGSPEQRQLAIDRAARCLKAAPTPKTRSVCNELTRPTRCFVVGMAAEGPEREVRRDRGEFVDRKWIAERKNLFVLSR